MTSRRKPPPDQAAALTGPATSEFLLYRTEDGLSQVQVRLHDGTVWLTQKQLAALYEVGVPAVNEHLRNIFREGELDPEATIRKFRIVRTEGNRTISRTVDHCPLPVVLAVGYRVRSIRGTQFRQWATARLADYVVKGFVLNVPQLKNPPPDGQGYFDELLEQIRDIRSSEKVFYKKVLEIYATSVDYDPSAEASQRFFATVQNKLHFAARGHTAAEVIVARADAGAPNMGMTSWSGARPRRTDALVAKNYLAADELEMLNLIVSAYLEFAEVQAANRRPMHMADWSAKLDEYLKLAGRGVLRGAGSVSHEAAVEKAQREAFSDKLDKTIARYRNRAIETVEVIEELLALAREMKTANASSSPRTSWPSTTPSRPTTPPSRSSATPSSPRSPASSPRPSAGRSKRRRWNSRCRHGVSLSMLQTSRLAVLAGVALAGACGGQPARAIDPADDAVTAPLIDPATVPLPAREVAPVVDPVPAAAPPAEAVAAPVGAPEAGGRFAVARVVDQERTFIDVYEIVAGEVRPVSTTALLASRMFFHEVVWADAGAPIVFRGGLVEPEGQELVGTIASGRFAAWQAKGKGELLGLVTSTAGEVWAERCARWDEDNPDEEGCSVRRYYRVTPKAGSATRRPRRRALPVDAVPAPATPTLQAKAHPTQANDFLLECTDADGTTTLLADEQVYEAPTWRWLSAEPPIALAAIAYAGMGGGDPDVDDHRYLLLRGCALAADEEPRALGPAGLWALQVERPDTAGTEHAWEVRWRGALLATVPGEAFAFAGGVP